MLTWQQINSPLNPTNDYRGVWQTNGPEALKCSFTGLNGVQVIADWTEKQQPILDA